MSTGLGSEKGLLHPFTSRGSGHYPGERWVVAMKLVSVGILAMLVATLVVGCGGSNAGSSNVVHGRGTRSASGATNFTVTAAGMLLQIRSGARNTWIVLRRATARR